MERLKGCWYESKYLVLLNIGLGFWLFYATITWDLLYTCDAGWGFPSALCGGANKIPLSDSQYYTRFKRSM